MGNRITYKRRPDIDDLLPSVEDLAQKRREIVLVTRGAGQFHGLLLQGSFHRVPQEVVQDLKVHRSAAFFQLKKRTNRSAQHREAMRAIARSVTSGTTDGPNTSGRTVDSPSPRSIEREGIRQEHFLFRNRHGERAPLTDRPPSIVSASHGRVVTIG
ncbi:MAG: hypothetical protein U0441_32440 [Polyangiaceae bacterium]